MIYKEIELVGFKGKMKKIALFDTGSTYSLIRKEIAESIETLLKLPQPIICKQQKREKLLLLLIE